MPPLAGMCLLCRRKLCSGSPPMPMPLMMVSNFDNLLPSFVAGGAGILEREALAVFDPDPVRTHLPARTVQELLRLVGVVLLVPLDLGVVGRGLGRDAIVGSGL